MKIIHGDGYSEKELKDMIVRRERGGERERVGGRESMNKYAHTCT